MRWWTLTRQRWCEAPPQRRRRHVVLGLLGLCFGLGPVFLGIKFGPDHVLTVEQVWQVGLAPLYLVGGLALALSAFFWLHGAKWARWLIALWYPVMFGCVHAWGAGHGVWPWTGASGVFFIGYLPMAGIWLWWAWWAVLAEP